MSSDQILLSARSPGSRSSWGSPRTDPQSGDGFASVFERRRGRDPGLLALGCALPGHRTDRDRARRRPPTRVAPGSIHGPQRGVHGRFRRRIGQPRLLAVAARRGRMDRGGPGAVLATDLQRGPSAVEPRPRLAFFIARHRVPQPLGRTRDRSVRRIGSRSASPCSWSSGSDSTTRPKDSGSSRRWPPRASTRHGGSSVPWDLSVAGRPSSARSSASSS